MYVSLELATIPLFVLAAWRRDDAQSGEAGLKYVIIGAMASAFILYGLGLLYGLTGSTELRRDSERRLQSLAGLLAGGRDARRGHRLQADPRAVPFVGGGCLSGRPGAGHGVSVGGLERGRPGVHVPDLPAA